ncbi:MAG: hypothetical protein WA417_03075 [Stellaceae bacterium]
MASGTAIVSASEKIIEKGRQMAAHVLKAAIADIKFAQGRFVIAATDRFIPNKPLFRWHAVILRVLSQFELGQHHFAR